MQCRCAICFFGWTSSSFFLPFILMFRLFSVVFSSFNDSQFAMVHKFLKAIMVNEKKRDIFCWDRKEVGNNPSYTTLCWWKAILMNIWISSISVDVIDSGERVKCELKNFGTGILCKIKTNNKINRLLQLNVVKWTGEKSSVKTYIRYNYTDSS